jgi:hypothetical protein
VQIHRLDVQAACCNQALLDAVTPEDRVGDDDFEAHMASLLYSTLNGTIE